MAPKKKSANLLRCPTCGMLVQLKDEDFPAKTEEFRERLRAG